MLTVHDVPIDDTFAEAFPMTAARLIVTAETPNWALTAGQVATGFASSVIGCDVEAGIEHLLTPEGTPDGRPGVVGITAGNYGGNLGPFHFHLHKILS
jgi:formylmethanofuran--tetrahydromethanopterin N-formyltransferase